MSYSLWSPVIVAQVGTLLVSGNTAGTGTSYKKLMGWRKVVTVGSHPHSFRVQFALSPLPTCRVHFWKPLGSLDNHSNILTRWFRRNTQATRYPRWWARGILCQPNGGKKPGPLVSDRKYRPRYAQNMRHLIFLTRRTLLRPLQLRF